jgi:hypothetical protein
MSEIVYAAGEGPGAPSAPLNSDQVKVRQPVKMVRAKHWTEDVEDNYRFQQAHYRDEEEYIAFNPHNNVRIIFYKFRYLFWSKYFKVDKIFGPLFCSYQIF